MCEKDAGMCEKDAVMCEKDVVMAASPHAVAGRSSGGGRGTQDLAFGFTARVIHLCLFYYPATLTPVSGPGFTQWAQKDSYVKDRV
eukprot:2860231-Pyramimonas_sp.AAC.1